MCLGEKGGEDKAISGQVVGKANHDEDGYDDEEGLEAKGVFSTVCHI